MRFVDRSDLLLGLAQIPDSEPIIEITFATRAARWAIAGGHGISAHKEYPTGYCNKIGLPSTAERYRAFQNDLDCVAYRHVRSVSIRAEQAQAQQIAGRNPASGRRRAGQRCSRASAPCER